MTKKEEKKSFVLHLDSLEILDALSFEQRGKLFTMIRDFQKDRPILSEDQLLQIALSPFIAQFKRDDEKWEEKSKSSKIANLKKWHPEYFKKFINEEISLEEAFKMAKNGCGINRNASSSDPIRPDPNGSELIETIRTDPDSSLSVSVSVNGSVSVSEINIISSLRSEINLNDDLWEKWRKHLKNLKKPLTDDRAELQLKKLKKLCVESGKTAKELVELALERGWQSFFLENNNNFTKTAVAKQPQGKFKDQDYTKGTEGFNVV